MPIPSWFRRSTSAPAPGTIPSNDSALVGAAKRDRQAFAVLYDRYIDDVYRYCLRRLDSREAAEDATAQVFVKALAALSGYRDDAPSFRSWLFAIAHNVVVDAHRARRLDVSLDEALTRPDPGPSPAEMAEAVDDLRQLRTLLGRLTEEQRALLELRLAGLTDAEIAAATGRDRKAVNAAQYRALQRLRALHEAGATVTEKGRP